MPFCTNCGNEVAADAVACARCGQPTRHVAPQPPPAAPGPGGAGAGSGAGPGGGPPSGGPTPGGPTPPQPPVPPPVPPAPPPQPPGQPGAQHPASGPPGSPPGWQQQQYGYVPVPVDAAGRPYASWGKRVVAGLVDWLILAFASMILLLVFTGGLIPEDPGDAGAFLAVQTILPLALVFAYRTILEGSERGQTVGKMATNIQVRDQDAGGPIGYGRAFLRYLVSAALFWACIIPGLLSILWPLWDERRQTLHDKIVRTVVIEVR